MQVLKEASQTVKEREFHQSSLVGGQGGKAWMDGTYTGIKKITVTENDETLTALQVQYGLKGVDKPVDGPTHGGLDGNKTVITLQYPKEYLTKISGYHGNQEGYRIVKSLKFKTSEGNEFGPYGEEEGTFFETTENGKIGGFFGRADATHIHAIGIYNYTDPQA